MSTRTPTVSTLLPTIENCDPILIHRRATPHAYALSERPILYGGGRKWTLKCSDPSCLQLYPLNHSNPLEVDVFVLNTGLLIWFVSCSKGVDIPYSSLGAHAVRKVEKKMMIHLQVCATGALESDSYAHDVGFEPTVELELVPMFCEDERYYNDSIERLFTYEFFGVNKGDKMVMSTFSAVSQCSAMWITSSEEEDDAYGEDVDGAVGDTYYEGGYDNTGDADDMDLNSSIEEGGASGVDVVFYDEYGRRRTRDEMESSPREVKRARS